MPPAPGLLGTVVIEDGSGADTGDATTYDVALAGGAAERDFPARSDDDVYIIYTGGTTGYPKGVMWRHEDLWRTLQAMDVIPMGAMSAAAQVRGKIGAHFVVVVNDQNGAHRHSCTPP